jgi:hypothetical protein
VITFDFSLTRVWFFFFATLGFKRVADLTEEWVREREKSEQASPISVLLQSFTIEMSLTECQLWAELVADENWRKLFSLFINWFRKILHTFPARHFTFCWKKWGKFRKKFSHTQFSSSSYRPSHIRTHIRYKSVTEEREIDWLRKLRKYN